jgi:hypothetical protein
MRGSTPTDPVFRPGHTGEQGLRQKLETSGDTRQKRLVNLLILEKTPPLLKVFRRGYEEDPEGCVLPHVLHLHLPASRLGEAVSMTWV